MLIFSNMGGGPNIENVENYKHDSSFLWRVSENHHASPPLSLKGAFGTVPYSLTNMGGGPNVAGYGSRHTSIRYKTWFGCTVAALFEILFTHAPYLHRRFILRHHRQTEIFQFLLRNDSWSN
jgi:hypothetical protein